MFLHLLLSASEQFLKYYDPSLAQVDRVQKIITGGSILSYRVLVVVGNARGAGGFGLGKALDPATATARAIRAAKKSLVRGGHGGDGHSSPPPTPPQPQQSATATTAARRHCHHHHPPHHLPKLNTATPHM